jgi:hypothetical protein
MKPHSNDALQNEKIWHVCAVLERAALRIDAATLQTLGVSIKESNRFLVQAKRQGFFTRHGKRGTIGGYVYLPTPDFWEFYQGMGFSYPIRQTAKLLKNGGHTVINHEYQGELF